MSSPLLKGSKWSVKAQPNGYALWEATDATEPSWHGEAYLNKKDLKEMQRAFEGFRSWSKISHDSGISAKERVFSVDRWRIVSVYYCAEDGRTWVDISISGVDPLRINSDQINEAQRLIFNTLQEMDNLEKVQNRLKSIR